MKKVLQIFLIVVITAFVSIVLTLYLVDSSETPSSYEVININSQILSENRELIVKLPDDYNKNSNKYYPVIYVFGGNTLTYSIVNDTNLLHRTGHLENVIVVGVSNINQKTRQRDLTPPFMKQDIDEMDSALGKANIYLNFIEEEVISLIDKKYRTSSYKIAVGHSREGLMVMYILTEKPNLFQGYLALSPALWREDNLFVNHFKEFIHKTDTIKPCLFLSMGTEEVEKMKSAFDKTVRFLNTDTISKKMKWKSFYTNDAVHSNNALLSAPIGIENILSCVKD